MRMRCYTYKNATAVVHVEGVTIVSDNLNMQSRRRQWATFAAQTYMFACLKSGCSYMAQDSILRILVTVEPHATPACIAWLWPKPLRCHASRLLGKAAQTSSYDQAVTQAIA